MRPLLRLVVPCLLSLLLAAPGASARSIEAGSFSLSGMVGPGIKYGKTLGGAPAYAMLAVQGDYAFDPIFSLVSDLQVGLAGSIPLLWHIGGRGRLSDLGGPLSPYAQLQLAVGGLYNILGADLTYVGGRVAAGLDYFFTATTLAGAMLGVDFGGTTGMRPAFYGKVDILLYGTYVF